VTSFAVAAIAMIVELVPALVVIVRGELSDAVVGFEFLTAVAVLIFALLAEAFGRPGEFEFPVLLAVFAFGAGLVFVRALERWL
jgi:multisubunit Na+/H+ antiporter MnhF subunit